jgi:hypothetical protein
LEAINYEPPLYTFQSLPTCLHEEISIINKNKNTQNINGEKSLELDGKPFDCLIIIMQSSLKFHSVMHPNALDSLEKLQAERISLFFSKSYFTNVHNIGSALTLGADAYGNIPAINQIIYSNSQTVKKNSNAQKGLFSVFE